MLVLAKVQITLVYFYESISMDYIAILRYL
jgi:hypothetical protein